MVLLLKNLHGTLFLSLSIQTLLFWALLEHFLFLVLIAKQSDLVLSISYLFTL